MAKKIYNYTKICEDGAELSGTQNIISYLRSKTTDSLDISTQFFIIDGDTDFIEMDINLVANPALTLILDKEGDVLSQIKVKLNGGDTQFNVAPIFQSEDLVESIQIANNASVRKMIYIIQVFAQEVFYG